MQITIPPEAEAFVRSKAAAAGFASVTQYVCQLIETDAGQQPADTFDNARRSHDKFVEASKQFFPAASEKATENSLNGQESAYEVAKRLGLIGGCQGGPSDLATNPEHMRGFGR